MASGTKAGSGRHLEAAARPDSREGCGSVLVVQHGEEALLHSLAAAAPEVLDFEPTRALHHGSIAHVLPQPAAQSLSRTGLNLALPGGLCGSGRPHHGGGPGISPPGKPCCWISPQGCRL